MKRALMLAILGQAAALAMAQGGAAKFTCGGVGQAEQEQFKRDAASHNALVTFATPSGSYVAGVDVKVSDAAGKMLAQGRCEGPLMLLDVPGAGKYRIDASYGGQQQRKEVQLGKGNQRLSFVWKGE